MPYCCSANCAANRLMAITEDQSLVLSVAGESGDHLVADAAAAREPNGNGGAPKNDLEGFATADAPFHYAPAMVLEPVHAHIDVVFDFANARAELCVTHTVRCNAQVSAASSSPAVARATSHLVLNGVGFENLQVGAADDSPAAHAVRAHEYDGERISVNWASPFACGEERRVTVRYTVERPVSGLFFAHPSYFPSAYGAYAVTDHETEKARYWLACVDEPTVRPRLTFRLTTPAHTTAVANGKLVSEEVKGESKVTTYDLDYPCPSYLLAMAAGDLVIAKDRPAKLQDGRELPIQYYGTKNMKPEHVLRGLDATPKMIEWLEGKVGVAHPWPKYYQITSSFIGGAMENQSFVTWGDFITLDDTHARDYKFHVDTVNVHELAHTYFGDMTVIRYFEHAWLKESWATYIESMWVEENVGATKQERRDRAKLYRFADMESYFAEAAGYLRPVVCRRYDHSWTMFDMHTYPGGSSRIHALRCLLGDDIFWRAVREYLLRFGKKTVETEDFRKVMEEVSGLNLTQFFQQWFHSKGHPKVKAEFEFSEDRGVATVSLEQTQGDLVKGIPVFAVDVAVDFHFADGTVKRGVASFDGISHTRGANKAYAVVAASSRPVFVEIDPDQHQVMQLKEFKPGRDMLLAIAGKASDVVNRVHAFRTLFAEHCDNMSVRKAVALISEEKSPGARLYAIKALAKLRDTRSIALLIDVVEKERSDDILAEAIDTLAFRDQRTHAASLRLLERTDLTYRQRGAALRVLAEQWQPGKGTNWDVLVKHAEDDSLAGHGEFVRFSAYDAIGRTKSEESARYLLSRFPIHFGALEGDKPLPSEHERVRIGLVTGLGRLVSWVESVPLRREILQRLVRAACDPHSEKVRKAAIFAVCGIDTAEAGTYAPHLERALKSTFSAQDQIRIGKRVQKLRAAAARGVGGVRELVTRIEELEKTLRKLESKYLDKEEAEERAKVAKKEANSKEAAAKEAAPKEDAAS